MENNEKIVKDIEKDKALPESSPADAPKNPKPFRSLGMITHNEITYRGVDWFANSTLGVTIAQWSQRTKHGQKWFGRPLSKMFEGITSNFTKNPKHIAEGGKWGSTIISIIIGGMSIIPVMTWLENKTTKKRMVKAMDEMFYGAEAVKNDPKFQTQYDAIDLEPEKDFATGNIARMAVLAPMIASTQIPAMQNSADRLLYTPLGNFTKAAAETMGIKPKSMTGKRDKNGKSDWDFLHHTIGFDFGLTFIYSFLHEHAYKAIAAVRQDKRDEKAEARAEAFERQAAPKPASEETATEKRWAGEPKRSFTERYQSQPSYEVAL